MQTLQSEVVAWNSWGGIKNIKTIIDNEGVILASLAWCGDWRNNCQEVIVEQNFWLNCLIIVWNL